MKYYEVKLYTQKWEFKKQINPINITNELVFSEELNWWQGNLNLELIWKSSDYICSDIVEIREIQKWVIKATYTWIIERIKIQEYKIAEWVTLELYGLHTLLNDIIYKDWSNKKFTKNWTAGEIVKDIIDYFNSQYSALFWDTQNLGTNIFNTTWIDETWTNISIEFDNMNCLRALLLVSENSWFNFYINQNWLVNFKTKENQTHKFLTFEREIISINRTLQKDDMVNKYYLRRAWDVEKVYQNNDSIDLFNLKELSESQIDIQNEPTQDIIWNEKINNFAFERDETSLTIKEVDLEPWYLISTLNTNNQLVNKQIVKIDKRKDNLVIYLEEFKSFWKVLFDKL